MPDRRALFRRTGVVAGLVGAGCAAMPAWAERWSLEAAVDSRVTVSSNAELGLAATNRGDQIFNLRPRLTVRGEGDRLKLSGSAAIDGVAYANHTQDSRLQPEADLAARLEAIERFFFLEAGFRAVRTSTNPYSLQPDIGTTSTAQTATLKRFSPVIDGRIPGTLSYTFRADNNWLHEVGVPNGTAATAGYFGRYSARVESVESRLGWRVEGQREYTRYTGDLLTPLGVGYMRGALTYAPVEDLRVGVRAGRETSNVIDGGVSTEQRSTGGVEMRWTPTPRTALDLTADRRFFGRSWFLALNHRMPQVAMSLNLSRTLDTSPRALFELGPTANVEALLDALYTTRFPDPNERARVVRDVIDFNGLPTSTLAPTTILGNRISLVTRSGLNVVFNGVRNTVAVAIFNLRTQDLRGSVAQSNGDPQVNNVQFGGSASLNHRLGAGLALTVGAEWLRVRALDTSIGDESVQRGINAQVSFQASPKTNAYVGARYKKLASNIVTTGQETAVFAGVDHRF